MQTSTPISSTPTASLSIRRLSPGHGLAWLAAGWSCFRRRWAPLAVLSTGMLIILWLLSQRGGILFPILVTVYLGIVAAWRRMDRQGEVFLAGSGAWRNPSLWGLAIVIALLSLAQAAIVSAIILGSMAQGWNPAAHLGKGMFYAFAAAQLLVILVFSTFWLAPALVVTRGAGVFRALRLSVAGSLRNPLSFLTVAGLGMLMILLGALPFGMGLLVAMPVLACAAAQAAEDIVA